jgi:hypothetical protein
MKAQRHSEQMLVGMKNSCTAVPTHVDAGILKTSQDSPAHDDPSITQTHCYVYDESREFVNDKTFPYRMCPVRISTVYETGYGPEGSAEKYLPMNHNRILTYLLTPWSSPS